MKTMNRPIRQEVRFNHHTDREISSRHQKENKRLSHGFSQRVNDLLVDKEMTQKDLANCLKGFNESHVSRLQNGTRPWNISRILQVGNCLCTNVTGIILAYLSKERQLHFVTAAKMIITYCETHEPELLKRAKAIPAGPRYGSADRY